MGIGITDKAKSKAKNKTFSFYIDKNITKNENHHLHALNNMVLKHTKQKLFLYKRNGPSCDFSGRPSAWQFKQAKSK